MSVENGSESVRYSVILNGNAMTHFISVLFYDQLNKVKIAPFK